MNKLLLPGLLCTAALLAGCGGGTSGPAASSAATSPAAPASDAGRFEADSSIAPVSSAAYPRSAGCCFTLRQVGVGHQQKRCAILGGKLGKFQPDARRGTHDEDVFTSEIHECERLKSSRIGYGRARR